MSLNAPSQMFEHTLDAKKGWFDMASLDFAAVMSTAVTFTVPQGRVVHIHTDGTFRTGVTAKTPAIFLLQGQDSFDVNNPSSTAGGIFVQQAIEPSGVQSGLVATGGYELSSTEFDTTKTYQPGDLLTAVEANTTLATGGVITNAGTGSDGKVKQFVDPVIGVVSTGKRTNHNNVSVLDFWCCYIPGAATN